MYRNPSYVQFYGFMQRIDMNYGKQEKINTSKWSNRFDQKAKSINCFGSFGLAFWWAHENKWISDWLHDNKMHRMGEIYNRTAAFSYDI